MSTPTKKVAFHTLGCKLNFSETSTISRDFIRYGFEKVNYTDKADLYVLNTCSVTENADKEARKLIRQAKRRNPNSSIAVIGCYAQLKPSEIASIEGVDLVLGAEEKFNLLKYLDKIDFKTAPTVVQTHIKHTTNFNSSFSDGERTRSFLKVQDGCDYTCSFCTIPQARGSSRSDTVKGTLAIAEKVANSNAREIVLTGVNIGDFGKGTPENFLDLLTQLDKLSDIDRIRISSIEPNLLTDEIILFCNNSNKFVPHFHLPLQSGSNKILKSMKRRYNKELYSERVSLIKSTNSEACIGVDVIVGFPGEEKEDFLKTYHFLNELDISYLHVFTYSERSKTDALKIKEVVSKENRSERSRMLHILSDKKKRYFYDKFVKSIRPVLFESFKNGKLIGHTDNYIKVEVEGHNTLINRIKNVKLIQNQGSFVEGVLN